VSSLLGVHSYKYSFAFAFCLFISSHTEKLKSYSPLNWSKFLKESAQEWANHLAETGDWDHCNNCGFGENLARHSDSTGNDRPPSDILTRWVENEMNDPVPKNGHMTQVLWWATEYVGCGEARKDNTFYQVCRYSKPGNCFGDATNFWDSVLADTPCLGNPLPF